MTWFRRKPLADLTAVAEEKKLTRALSAFDVTLLGLGVIIGTGIFVLTGIGAATYAGPGLMLSFVLAAITCAFVCLAYAELVSILPVSGSAYTYTYASLGEFFGWWVGWGLVLEYSVGASAVAGGWSAYLVGILHAGGIDLPQSLTAVPHDGGIVNLPAMLIVLFATFLLVLGIRESAKVNRVLVLIKIATIFLFIFLAGPHVDPINWEPFLPFGWQGVAAGTGILFFAYLGVDALATAAEETKNPKVDMPVGIMASLIICTILYIAVSAVMTGVVPYPQLDTAAPATYVLEYIGSRAGSAIVGTGALCGLSTVLLVMIYAQTRAFYAMSRDGLIPKGLCKIHKKYHTPHIITMIVGVVVSLIAGFTPIHIVAEMCSAGTLFAFMCASLGVMVLRRVYPDVKRDFRCPAVYIVAPLAILFCGFVFSQLSAHTIELFVSWSILGALIYVFYSRKHSVLAKAHREEVQLGNVEIEESMK